MIFDKNKKELVMSELLPGDVVLFYHPFSILDPISIVTLLIRKICKTKYNHAGILVKNWDKWFLCESVNRGVLARIAEIQLNGSIICILRSKSCSPKTDAEVKALSIKINSYLGARYDFMSLVYYQLIYSFKHKWQGKTRSAATDKLFCYEYVENCYPTLFNEPWKALPNDFEDNKEFEIKFIGKINSIKE